MQREPTKLAQNPQPLGRKQTPQGGLGAHSEKPRKSGQRGTSGLRTVGVGDPGGASARI